MKRGALKNVATARYDFAALRENDDYVYVDKTDMLVRLASKEKDAIYFISRPRRFGKSLMISTLKCMFEGRKELFRGLKIMKSGWDWKQTFPVIHLDMDERDFSALVRVAERQIAGGDIQGLVVKTLYQLYAKLPPTWTPKNEADAKRYFCCSWRWRVRECSPRGLRCAAMRSPTGHAPSPWSASSSTRRYETSRSRSSSRCDNVANSPPSWSCVSGRAFERMNHDEYAVACGCCGDGHDVQRRDGP